LIHIIDSSVRVFVINEVHENVWIFPNDTKDWRLHNSVTRAQKEEDVIGTPYIVTRERLNVVCL